MGTANPWTSNVGVLVIQHGPAAAEFAEMTAAVEYTKQIGESSSHLVKEGEDLLRAAKSVATDAETDKLVAQIGCFIESLSHHHNLTDTNLNIVRGTLDHLYQKLLSVSNTNHQLITRMRVLERQVLDLQQQMNRQRRAVLLGQVAYIIDKAAAEYVGMRRRTATLNEIDYASRFRELSKEQETRWVDFKQMLSRLSWTVMDVVSVSSALRFGRLDIAHDDATELQSVSSDDLKTWVREQLPPDSISDADGLIDLASNFAEEHRPLCKLADIHAAVQRLLN